MAEIGMEFYTRITFNHTPIDLTWRKEQLTLITARKSVREWASLDRLVAHIHEAYGTAPPITLKLCDTEELNR